jgi:hypothetical protein
MEGVVDKLVIRESSTSGDESPVLPSNAEVYLGLVEDLDDEGGELLTIVGVI